MTATSKKIEALASYGLGDWAVTASEERQIIRLLLADPNVSLTVTDLNQSGMLTKVLDRVDEKQNIERLLQVLGGKTTTVAAADLVRKAWQRVEVSRMRGHKTYIPKRSIIGSYGTLFDMSNALQSNLRRLGGVSAAPAFNSSPFSYLISSNLSAPFTGVGATGHDPHSLSIGIGDQWRLFRKDPATVAKYSNPVGSLPGYLATLSARARRDQARLLLQLTVVSVLSDSYAGSVPSRAAVMTLAGKAHKLEGALIAAFVLAEQRDQSQREDAKDLIGATSVARGNTSIGLGQVVVSTARRNDLFADLLPAKTRKHLSHSQIAHLLASDDFNIFAVARYIRKVADQASRLSIASLPNTQAAFPGVAMADYAKHSRHWPADNIRAMGSEYTSRAWDDVLVPAWGDFVHAAYTDVKATGLI